MNRRKLLLGTSALVAAALTPGLIVAATNDAALPPFKLDKALLDAAVNCGKVAEVCLAHCQRSLSTGDTMLKDCSRSVSELIPVCNALASLAAQGSAFLPKYAKMALEICKSCEKECRKHEGHHIQCKDCADACAACAKECRRVSA